MTETAHSVTLDDVRSARRRIHAYIGEEIRELGADATALAEQARDMNGLEFFERWLRPEMPPVPTLAFLFCTEWIEIEPSRVALTFEPAEWMFNPITGAVFGGIAATVLDLVLGAAVHTTLPAGAGYATTDLHTRYIRAMTAGTGRMIATAAAVHSGRLQATAEGRIEAEETGKLIATGTAGCTILRPS